ncbi:MAG TPA: chemotaxis protein CheA [Bacillota bacterium]|nr:chemotaxis protein CheA [Bacillota bacterium]
MVENDSMLEMYLFESSMLLDQLDEILLQSEKNGSLSAENINEIFRIMHTIKGSSAMMEFDLLSHVSHRLEDLFYYIRENGVRDGYFQDVMDLVLEVSDFLKTEMEKIRNSQELDTEKDSLIEQISQLLEQMKGETPAPAKGTSGSGIKGKDDISVPGQKEPGVPAKEEPSDKSSDKLSAGESGQTDKGPTDGNTYHLRVHFCQDCQMENVRAFLLVNKLDSLGKVLRTVPEDLHTDQNASSYIAKNGFYCSVSTSASPEEIEIAAKNVSSVEEVEFINGFPFDGETESPTEEGQKPQGASDPESQSSPSDPGKPDDSIDSIGSYGSADSGNAKGKPASSDSGSKSNGAKQNLIAVDLNKLDTLMDLVGEIVITESMVSGSPDLEGLNLESFNKATRQLRKLTDELQDIVMSIRMVPVASTFQKMHRIVRDMNKKLDRDVELILMGESTEVDKTIIDGIYEPLLHLVRNAMDHGIEDKETRLANQKDPNGRIILSAQNVGGEIIITVSDDGKGLDPIQILEKAKNRNLLTKPENEYTEKEIFNLLTLPGFSTKDAVTEYSGRGVGLDVVKKNIEKLGGTITIESQRNVGTTVFIKIPLTLAIVSSMEIQVGEEIFAIPIANIRESFKATVDQVFTDPDNNEMIMLRGTPYPVIRLNRVYNIADGFENIEDGVFLLAESSEGTACLFADEILGKHQVVVKPLPAYLSRFNVSSMGISGCTILGNGNISLILDVQGILKQY